MKFVSILFIVIITLSAYSKVPYWCMGGHYSLDNKSILHTEITPDNKYFISSGTDPSIRIFELASGSMINSLSNSIFNDSSQNTYPEFVCRSFVVSNDSKFLITDHGYIYSIPDGKLIRRLQDTTFSIGMVIASVSDSIIILVGDGNIKYINFYNDKLILENKYDKNDIIFDDYFITPIIVTHDKTKIVYYNSETGEFSIIELQTGKLLKKKDIFNMGDFVYFDIDHSDRIIYAKKSRSDFVLEINIDNLEILTTKPTTISKIQGLQISPNGKFLFMNGMYTNNQGFSWALYRCNIDNLNDFSMFLIYNITDIEFLNDDKKAIVTSWEGNYSNIINYEDMLIEKNIISHNLPIKNVAFSPDDKYFSTVEQFNNNKIQIFDVAKRERKFQFFLSLQNSDEIQFEWIVKPFVNYSRDNKYMIFAGGANEANSSLNSIYLYDANDGSYLNEFRGHTQPISNAIFSNDGKGIISISIDSTIRFWDISSGKETNKIKLPYKLMNITESNDGKRYYVVNLFDYGNVSTLIKVDKESQIITNFNLNISSQDNFISASKNTSFSNDRKFFAYESVNFVNIFDLDSEKIIRTIPFTYPRYCSFSRDNKFILLVGDSAKCEMWDISNNCMKANDYSYPNKLRFNNDRIHQECPATNLVSCFSNQNNLFAMGTDDASAIIWDYTNITSVRDESYLYNPLNKEIFLKENVIINENLTLIFKIATECYVKVELLDITGNIIQRFDNLYIPYKNYQYEINLSNYLTGMYFCKVLINNNIEILNFLIIR